MKVGYNHFGVRLANLFQTIEIHVGDAMRCEAVGGVVMCNFVARDEFITSTPLAVCCVSWR
jgi:hypothetical protein